MRKSHFAQKTLIEKVDKGRTTKVVLLRRAGADKRRSVLFIWTNYYGELYALYESVHPKLASVQKLYKVAMLFVKKRKRVVIWLSRLYARHFGE